MPLIPIRAAILAFALAAPAAALAQAPAFSDPQRRAIEQIVKEYLLKNPEILHEALLELEKRQQEAQKVAQRTALKEHRAAIVNPSRSIVAGNPSGDVTLVEFFDYNCGYCKRALTDIQTLVKADPKLKVVLKDFPVLGPDSVEAARVSVAVKQQLSGAKLFDFHTRVLETRGRVNGDRALAVAKEMGLDMGRLQKDLDSAETRAVLQENMTIADRLGLTGTPAFILGEDIIPGAVGAEPLRQAIASVRKCGKAEC
ncbi:MAG TPA: DsbA family protein [Beijerinckiaceae bacterium]|nr:DsbA family protein [Beijerinckiaceae bacterium]